MSNTLYRDLQWLQPAPADFRHRCRTLLEGATIEARPIVELANHSLDENQLLKLNSVIERYRSDGNSSALLTPFKLALVGSSTLDMLPSALIATAARFGILLSCEKAHFGQTVQVALDPSSAANQWKPDAILISLDYRFLGFGTSVPSDQESDDRLSAAISLVRTIRDGFRKNAPRSVCIFETVARPPETLFGSFDRCVKGTTQSMIRQFNERLARELAGTTDLLLDIANLAETVGLADWNARKQWDIAKLAFDSSFVPLYADHICRLVNALRGKSRKCLILDLDNTIWGGVIGDDGLGGILLGQGNASGEAFLAVQRFALELRARGIVLAVSSKNTDSVARDAFRNHSEMLLREESIAVFQANWNDKATNIVAIAQELALGLDAMVFLDDNPVERGLVRSLLPDVAVPELPDDPALYARTLAAAGYFESIAFSDEDRKRAQFYEDNARRVALQEQAGDIDTYLLSLNMHIEFRPFDADGRARIAQLINKSNQFNLTTRRYTESDVAVIEGDDRTFTLQVRLRDAFGDNGMIGVVICRAIEPGVWEIDTWLMSCRVLGRRVEQMVLREILHHARSHEIAHVIGVFVPSAKNAMVADHYQKLGFSLIASDDAGTTRWSIDTITEIAAPPMIVARSGFHRVSIGA